MTEQPSKPEKRSRPRPARDDNPVIDMTRDGGIPLKLYLDPWELRWVLNAIEAAEIQGVNEQQRLVQAQKTQPSEATMTIVKFKQIAEGVRHQIPPKHRRAWTNDGGVHSG